MELDELTYKTATSSCKMIEELKKAIEQVIQFLEQSTKEELDFYVMKEA